MSFKLALNSMGQNKDSFEKKVGKECFQSLDFSMKLVIDKKANKVIFAEAAKEVIDIFINFLFIAFFHPMARSMIRHINKVEYCGILNLYDSIGSLNDSYFLKPIKAKDLYKPESSFNANSFPFFPNLVSQPSSVSGPKFFMCSSFHRYVTENPKLKCPTCKKSFEYQIPYVNGDGKYKEELSGDSNYVKGDITYMVMDNLKVIPMSNVSIISVVNKVNIMDVNSLEEKVVTLNYHQMIELMKISAESKTTLTDYFLKKQGCT
ncbi:hypothetical protein FRX31_017456 [Thalictrum thalictroides]|uniref:Uncharacterized protein n=1 Tax=Thalictrum thalictroides TaxID=46969 RepID=A0A7J6W809_THATH|nr:hypothetical protein FRX31_017456 [Thalictrum thalictroides]